MKPEDLIGDDAALFHLAATPRRSRPRAAPARSSRWRASADAPQAAVELDVVVGSGEDNGERYHPGDLEPPPSSSYHLRLARRLDAAGRPATRRALPGPVSDAYGCGDWFAAALKVALARGDDAADAVALAARCGAAVMTGRGPYERQLTGAEL